MSEAIQGTLVGVVTQITPVTFDDGRMSNQIEILFKTYNGEKVYEQFVVVTDSDGKPTKYITDTINKFIADHPGNPGLLPFFRIPVVGYVKSNQTFGPQLYISKNAGLIAIDPTINLPTLTSNAQYNNTLAIQCKVTGIAQIKDKASQAMRPNIYVPPQSNADNVKSCRVRVTTTVGTLEFVVSIQLEDHDTDHTVFQQVQEFVNSIVNESIFINGKFTSQKNITHDGKAFYSSPSFFIGSGTELFRSIGTFFNPAEPSKERTEQPAMIFGNAASTTTAFQAKPPASPNRRREVPNNTQQSSNILDNETNSENLNFGGTGDGIGDGTGEGSSTEYEQAYDPEDTYKHDEEITGAEYEEPVKDPFAVDKDEEPI